MGWTWPRGLEAWPLEALAKWGSSNLFGGERLSRGGVKRNIPLVQAHKGMLFGSERDTTSNYADLRRFPSSETG